MTGPDGPDPEELARAWMSVGSIIARGNGTGCDNPDPDRRRGMRMESSQGGAPGSAVDMPVGKIPGAAVDYVRARRELKLQETLLESMVRQYEIAKLDEAKEGPALQQVDVALPPDYKSKPSRAFRPSRAMTRGSLRSFQSSWLCPTSSATTRRGTTATASGPTAR